MITENAIVAAVKSIETAELEGEAVLLDINTGHYYGLSTVGAQIISMLKEPVRVSFIVEKLLQEYDVDVNQLRGDIIGFLLEMKDRKLIETINGEVA